MKPWCYCWLLLFSGIVAAQPNSSDTLVLSNVLADTVTPTLQALQARTHTLQQKALLSQQKQDYKAALEINRILTIAQDSIQTLQHQQALAAVQTQLSHEQANRLAEQQQYALQKQRWITALVALAAISFGIWTWYRYQQTQQQHTQALLQQQHHAATALIDAEEKERHRIATELHDGVGQMMSAIKMNLSGIYTRNSIPNQQEQESLAKTLHHADESCRELRNLSHNIMPNTLLQAGLTMALQSLIDRIDSNTLHVHLHMEGFYQQPADKYTDIVLYRALQEIISNVLKHAQASELDISIIKDDEGISCTVEDNGRGFDPQQITKGLGLNNVQSRIQYVNGTVEWDAAPGRGTVVAIHLPAYAKQKERMPA